MQLTQKQQASRESAQTENKSNTDCTGHCWAKKHMFLIQSVTFYI